MSVYNEELYIEKAIQSIINQSFEDFEFIIVNDASTDHSLELMKRYAKRDKRIKLLENKTRCGLTRSLNKAIKIAEGKYIARQDADDLSSRKRLEKQLNLLKSNSKVGLVGTSILLINERNNIIGEVLLSERPNLLRGNHIIHGSVMLTRDALVRSGVYNDLFKYSQDYELWLRIFNHYDVRNLKERLYLRRLHSRSTGLVHKKEQVFFALLSRKLADNGLRNTTLSYSTLNLKEKVNLFKEYGFAQIGGHLWGSKIGRLLLYFYHSVNWLINKKEKVRPLIFTYAQT